jgi:hypothetical protein
MIMPVSYSVRRSYKRVYDSLQKIHISDSENTALSLSHVADCFIAYYATLSVFLLFPLSDAPPPLRERKRGKSYSSNIVSLQLLPNRFS